MIAVVGDIHGQFRELEHIVAKSANLGASAVIQVGDFGWYQSSYANLQACKFDVPVYWIDGNHEDHKFMNLHVADDIVEVHHNCFYVPRGCVLELDNRRFMCIGGASSVDKAWRINEMRMYPNAYDVLWSELENIRDSDVHRFERNATGEFHAMFCHVPPQFVIEANFNRNQLRWFGLDPSWTDPDAIIIEYLWNSIKCPPLYCGHMHRSVKHDNCVILSEFEVQYI